MNSRRLIAIPLDREDASLPHSPARQGARCSPNGPKRPRDRLEAPTRFGWLTLGAKRNPGARQGFAGRRIHRGRSSGPIYSGPIGGLQFWELISKLGLKAQPRPDLRQQCLPAEAWC
jgi:hypothetical protein